MSNMTIPLLSFIGMGTTALVCIVIPIILMIVMPKKTGSKFTVVMVGVLAFFVPQLLIRIPLIQFLSTKLFYQQFAQNNIYLYGLVLGLTAGLFEEFGRWAGFKWIIKKRRSWGDGISFGIGHWGIEAIFLVGLTMINNIVIGIFYNNNMLDVLVKTPEQMNALSAAVNALTNTAPELFFFGGIERLLTLPIHLSLTLIVLLGIKRHKASYFWLAVLLHTLVDASIVWFGEIMRTQFAIQGNLYLILLEILVVFWAAICILIINASKKQFAMDAVE